MSTPSTVAEARRPRSAIERTRYRGRALRARGCARGEVAGSFFGTQRTCALSALPGPVYGRSSDAPGGVRDLVAVTGPDPNPTSRASPLCDAAIAFAMVCDI